MTADLLELPVDVVSKPKPTPKFEPQLPGLKLEHLDIEKDGPSAVRSQVTLIFSLPSNLVAPDAVARSRAPLFEAMREFVEANDNIHEVRVRQADYDQRAKALGEQRGELARLQADLKLARLKSEPPETFALRDRVLALQKDVDAAAAELRTLGDDISIYRQAAQRQYADRLAAALHDHTKRVAVGWLMAETELRGAADALLPHVLAAWCAQYVHRLDGSAWVPACPV